MKNEMMSRYISCFQAIHMPVQRRTEMLQLLQKEDIAEQVSVHRHRNEKPVIYSRAAAFAICMILCVTIGWFVYLLHEHIPMQTAKHSSDTLLEKTQTEIRNQTESVNLSGYIERGMIDKQIVHGLNTEDIWNSFRRSVERQNEALSAMENGQDMMEKYLKEACQQVVLLEECKNSKTDDTYLNWYEKEKANPLLILNAEYTADRTLYLLMVNTGNTEITLDCSKVWIHSSFGEQSPENYAYLPLIVPHEQHSCLTPYLNGTVNHDAENAQIPAHGAIELCCVLPEQMRFAYQFAPAIKLFSPDGELLYEPIDTDFSAPAISRREENEIVGRLLKVYGGEGSQ